MIKVIHVISDMNIGGAGRWLLNLLQEINKDKYVIEVVIPKGSKLKDELINHDAEIMEVYGMGDKCFAFKSMSDLYKIFKAKKPDIVHTHASLSARIAAKIANINSIIHTKHCIDQIIESNIKTRIRAKINVFLSDYIIAVAEAAKANLILSGIPEDMIIAVHNGVEKLREVTELEKEQIKKKWNIAPDDVVIGVVARFEEVKGHTYFIEAANKVLKHNNKVKFILIGTGSKEEELKKLVKKLSIQEKIIFTGYIRDIAPIMNIIDINVISSLSEALCLSLIEGMSLAKPSIATNTGGNPELVVIGDNGFLVPVKDSFELKNAMTKLIINPELRKIMGQNGRQIMENNFTALAMTKKIENIYDNILNN